MNTPTSIPLIRRVVLRTADATRLAAFYQTLLGLRPRQDVEGVSLLHPAGGGALLTLIEDRGARPAAPQAPGLFHTAFLFPGLGDWHAAAGRAVALSDGRCGASDHGVSWAVYLADPDGNGIELAWDRPEHEWPWHGDRIRMVTRPLPLRGILADGGAAAPSDGSFHIGHLHLQVADLAVAAIYQECLGLHVTQSDYPGALFMARGRYHHHLAINTWRSDPRVLRAQGSAGLVGWDIMAVYGSQDAVWQDPEGYQVTLLAAEA